MVRMLLVDDKEVFLRTLKRMPFFRENTETVQIVRESNSAAGALEILRREEIDIVMTDIRMPMMSGIELLKAIQRENLCPCTILMSEYKEFAYAREGILYGAFDYVVKPLDDAVLASTMDRAIAFLGKIEAERKRNAERNGVTAAELMRMLQTRDDALFEKQVEEVSGRLFAKPDPQDGALQIRRLQEDLRDALHAEYAYLDRYLPLENILQLQDTDSSMITADRFRHMLRFLRRKLRLFRLDSDNKTVRNIWHYTIQHADEPCRLADTAQRFFLNASYLSSLFKKETGISYKAFVQELKMERARRLLADPDQKISAIAARLHYTDPEYFRKTFKISTGVSPAKFEYTAYVDDSG